MYKQNSFWHGNYETNEIYRRQHTRRKQGRGFKETSQSLVMIRDMADHIMKHTQCGQFLLSGYAFWISVTIK
jgi:hypothetical protein